MARLADEYPEVFEAWCELMEPHRQTLSERRERGRQARADRIFGGHHGH